MRLKRFGKLRFLLTYPLVAWLFLTAHTTERQLFIGAAIALMGLAVRFWANGYVGHVKVNSTQKWRGDVKIGHLITAGPYAFLRHPLYFGTLLIGLGFCVVAGQPILTLVALAFFLIVYRRKMAEEEATLRDEWGEEFTRYERSVPRWLPRWRRYTHPHGVWSWNGIVASKEPKTVAWVIVFLLILYFREELVQERELYGAKHLVLLAVMGLCMLSDGIFEVVRRWQKIKSFRRSVA